MRFKYIVVFLFVFVFAENSEGQIIDEAQAKTELKKRGIDEEELRAKLLERGIDIDNIDTNNPAKLLETQNAIEEAIKELEEEKKQLQNVIPQDTVENKKEVETENILSSEGDIKDAVKDGATLDEAISEEIQEKQKEKLPDAQVYGHHLFRNNSVKYYRKSQDAKPPSTYIIGPGDQVSISIWGQSELNFSQEVSSDGFIKPVEIPRIYIAGLSIEEAKDNIKRKLSRSYRFDDNTFAVNVVTSRTINVNITGEVFNVGSYSISALNTAFNALVAAGGPSDIGSVRRIKVVRSGGSPKTLDIYKYLSNPLVNEEFYLMENDYIIVPVAEKIVNIIGAITRPYKYELLDNENLNELLKYAGGVKPNALKRSVKIRRIANDKETILNVNLNELESRNRNFDLKNGDFIEIIEIPKEYENIVSINGSVELPGEFAYKEGMRISDLISMAQIEEDAILSNAYLMRLNPDKKTVRYEMIDISQVMNTPRSDSNILLERGDVVTIRSRSSFVDKKTLTVAGAVRIEGDYPFNGGVLKISDAIFLSGGLTETATDFAFVFRDKLGKEDAEYIAIDLAKALAEDTKHNIVLEPGDKLIVYDRSKYVDKSFISVSGAVKEPIQIDYDSSLTIKKALLLSGGLTYDASLQQIDVFRLEFNDRKKTKTLVANVSIDKQYNLLNGEDFSLLPFDQIIVRKAPEFELQRNVDVTGEVRYPGEYALVSENTRLSEIVKQSGGATGEAFLKGATLYRVQDDVGYIIIDLERALKKKGSAFDAILQEGDSIYIPKKNDLVTVTGAVLAGEAFSEEIALTGKYNFVYEPGKNAKYYVDKYAGGVAKDGRASKITVTYPNGEVKKTGKFIFFNRYPKVEPGSVIHVGKKDKKDPLAEDEKEDIDWGKVLSDSVAQATTILTLVILINNLN